MHVLSVSEGRSPCLHLQSSEESAGNLSLSLPVLSCWGGHALFLNMRLEPSWKYWEPASSSGSFSLSALLEEVTNMYKMPGLVSDCLHHNP